MLKGPSLTSKTYFVPLPETLDQLLAKAVQLFPVPPGKVPHITLGTDERAIILQESYDFIRDRELLHFRWSAETPRRNLANRVRWDQVAASASSTPFPLNSAASPQSSPAENHVPSPVASAAEALKAQLQTSPPSKRDLTSTTRANTIANRDPNTQFGEGVAARKAHVQRVLAEQQRKREEENTADALGAAPLIAEADQDAVVESDPEATAKAVLELATTAMSTEGTSISNVQTESSKDAVASLQGVDMIVEDVSSGQTETATTQLEPEPVLSSTEIAASEPVLAPAAVSLAIESPPRKKHVDNGGLDTPPSSGSRSSSPFHSSDRASNSARSLDNRMRAEADDEPSSSPMSSPTRDISSRYRNIVTAVPPMPELTITSTAGSLEDEEQPQESSDAVDATSSRAFEREVEPVTRGGVPEASSEQSASSVVDATARESVATKPTSNPANDHELNRIYSFLSNLISQLLSHKANWAFQRPMSVEFEQFSTRSSRPVDLFTIRDSLTSRKYGSQHLEGRMAANAVVTDFEDDLTLLYTNARRFFGIRSTQAECVEHLEKFSRSFLNEWKRTQGSVTQAKSTAQSSSDAAARLSAFRSPGSRSEKRPGMLSSSPFAMLLTPRASPASGIASSCSDKKTVSSNGQPALPGATGLLHRPDFAFKRNTSYEGSFSAAKRPAQPTRTTSEAFERALRAATATPQTERVKSRQEVIAPFATRSVIETDFMARPAPQRQPEAPSTPLSTNKAAARAPSAAGNKRKAGEAAANDGVEQAPHSHSPSLSPPPSPSPTKRTRQVTDVKPSKSAMRRNNKKKARQAAAAAAAAAAAVKLTEQKRSKKVSADDDEEQHGSDLLDVEPVSKRARTTRGSNRDIDSQQSTPEAKGKGKGKKGKSAPTPAPEAFHPNVIPSTPSGRSLRPRLTSTSNNELVAFVPSPKTPPRSGKEGNARQAVAEAVGMEENDYAIQSMDVDGFEVTGSRRRSSRQRKPVNLD